MKRALPLLALALAGCQTTRTVATPCIAKDQALPEEPKSITPDLTGEADKDTRVLAGGLLRWQSYGRGLRSILETCRDK